jgi:hypothetical protein
VRPNAQGALSVITVGRAYLEVVMRMMLKAIVDTDAGNEVFRRGGVVEAVDRIQHVLQPEAFYEFVENGQRTVFAVFDMADPSQIPVITEPLFNLAKAKIAATHRSEYPEPGGERSGATRLPGAVPLRYASIPIT